MIGGHVGFCDLEFKVTNIRGKGRVELLGLPTQSSKAQADSTEVDEFTKKQARISDRFMTISQ